MRKTSLFLIIALIFFFVVLISLIGTSFFSSLFIDPSKPTVNYGEFPFKLTYKVNDTLITVEDTLIIRYEGVIVGEQKYNKWNTSLKSGSKLPIIIYNGTDENGRPFSMKFLLGSCEYYMGLKELPSSIYYFETIHPGDIIFSESTELVLEKDFEKYNIQIIEKVLSPPLKTG